MGSTNMYVLGNLGTDSFVSSLIGKKANYDTISKALFEDLSNYEKEQFELLWVDESQRLTEDGGGPLTLEKSGRLMQLNF